VAQVKVFVRLAGALLGRQGAELAVHLLSEAEQRQWVASEGLPAVDLFNLLRLAAEVVEA